MVGKKLNDIYKKCWNAIWTISKFAKKIKKYLFKNYCKKYLIGYLFTIYFLDDYLYLGYLRLVKYITINF